MRGSGKISEPVKRRLKNNHGYIDIIIHSGGAECADRLLERGIGIKYTLPFINAICLRLPKNYLPLLLKQKTIRFIEYDEHAAVKMDIAVQSARVAAARHEGCFGSGIGIAIADTGVAPHPDIANRIIAFKDFINFEKLAYDDNGHGTFCAGIASGGGEMSDGKYIGVAPLSNIIGLKVLDSQGDGSISSILSSMQWTIDNKDKYNIRVFSMSLGARQFRAQSDDALVRGVEMLWRNGLVVVVAAGNDGPAACSINSPGSAPSIITVGAADDRMWQQTGVFSVAEFSSRGPAGVITKPDILAPGVMLVSADFQNGYTMMSGTSASAPFIAGVAALLLGENPRMTPNMVKQCLLNSAMDIGATIAEQGWGVVNTARAIEIARCSSTPDKIVI